MKESNSNYNRYGGISKKERILKTVRESEIELTPKIIAQKTGLNHSTVKVYLRQLLEKNKIVQPYPGSYCSQITHGMMMAPLRTHNVILTVEAPWLRFSDDYTEWYGDVKVRVQFGLQRHKITGRISCEAGMDRNSVHFALSRFYDIVKERTSHDVEQVVVKTFEVNRDYAGIRLDGFKCYTRKGLFGAIERIYQKDELVRHEHKITKPMTIDEFTALVRGGVTEYNVQQGLFVLAKKVEALTEAQKFINEKFLQIMKVQNAILQKLERTSKEGKGC